jgi:outer membrane lipoprotein-sorting protein
MERILQIPVRPDEFMSLLTGRVPLHEHDYAILQENTGAEGYVLELEKTWQGVVQRIYLDRSKAVVQSVELFDESGFLIYRAVFTGFKNYNHYGIPSRLMVSTEGSRRFQLDISHYQTDVDVNEKLFVLTPPQ